MQRSQCTRIMLAIALIAPFLIFSTPSFARGRGGGGRTASGRTHGAPRSGNAQATRARPGNGQTGPSRQRARNRGKSNQFSPRTNHIPSQGTPFSPHTGNRRPRSARDKQIQNLLQERSGPWQGNRPQQRGQYQQHADLRAPQQFQRYRASLSANPLSTVPFSSTWYAGHPSAWQATHPKADAVLFATTAAVAAWLGNQYQAPANSGGSSTTVVYQEAPPEEAIPESARTDPTTQVMANVSEPIPGPTESWLSLGIYSVSIAEGVPPTRMLQLAINHQGDLRGVFYDRLTDTSQNIVGQLNRETQVAQWSYNSNSKISFEASLEQLTRPNGLVRVTLPSGPEQWNLQQVDPQGK